MTFSWNPGSFTPRKRMRNTFKTQFHKSFSSPAWKLLFDQEKGEARALLTWNFTNFSPDLEQVHLCRYTIELFGSILQSWNAAAFFRPGNDGIPLIPATQSERIVTKFFHFKISRKSFRVGPLLSCNPQDLKFRISFSALNISKHAKKEIYSFFKKRYPFLRYGCSLRSSDFICLTARGILRLWLGSYFSDQTSLSLR